ncbi:hypothetical protein Hanom_Chr02g00137921 [Helianthus anomalus]
MDMKQKLEGKILKEFVDPPKETTAEEKEKEHEEAIDRYIANPPRTANQKPRKKMVMRNVGAERDLQFGDRPDRHVITTEKDKHGNRSGIHSWAYNDEKGIFIVLRKNEDVEYYDNSAAFESWKEDEEVLDPAIGNPYKIVRWPATKQTKTIPLLKELLDNSLKDLKFWMYDPVTNQAVIVCENAEYRFLDTRDLMCFGENDINHLSRTQIESDPQYNVFASATLSQARLTAEF